MMLSRWILAIYSGLPAISFSRALSLPAVAGEPLGVTRHRSPTMIRAIPPIWFHLAKENYHSIRGVAFSFFTANVESSRHDKSQRRLRSEIKHGSPISISQLLSSGISLTAAYRKT